MGKSISSDEPLSDAERLGALILHGDDTPETIAGMYERGELERGADGFVTLRAPKRAPGTQDGGGHG